MEAINYELVRILVAVAGTGFAAYQDYKTSFIDEKIVYAMIAIGFFLNLLPFIYANDVSVLYISLAALLIFAFGYLFYRKGQLGMGDVLLFVAIQQVIPLAPNSFRLANSVVFDFPPIDGIPGVNWFLVAYMAVFRYLLFFLGIFLLSSFIATIGSSLQYAIALFKSKKKLKPNRLYAIISVFVLTVGVFLLYTTFKFSMLFVLFVILFLASAFFLVFKDQILEEIVIRKIPIKEIEDEDILAIERMPQEYVKKYKLEKVLTKAQVKALSEIQRKEGMKLFPVNKILPRFGPYILIALVVGLFLGNIIEIILFFNG